MIKLMVTSTLLALALSSLAVANDTIDAAAKEKGAVKTLSGMVYIPIKEGSGDSPKGTNIVGVDYRGTLPNGHEFDSSYKSKMVVKFPLSGVIPCWTEGLQMMKTGGKAKFFCPPELAYGSDGAGRISRQTLPLSLRSSSSALDMSSPGSHLKMVVHGICLSFTKRWMPEVYYMPQVTPLYTPLPV